jgi:hypothetical protein
VRFMRSTMGVLILKHFLVRWPFFRGLPLRCPMPLLYGPLHAFGKYNILSGLTGMLSSLLGPI